MIRRGHILVKLADCTETRAPAHLDVLDGACRAAGSVDGFGAVDAALHRLVSGIRCRRCYHGAGALRRPGARASDYSTLERSIGLDRVVALELAEPERMDAVIAELRALDAVDWATAEPLSTTPMVRPATVRRVAESAFARVGAAAALEMEPGSRQVAVAVIDTGVALDHAEFRGRLRAGYDTVDLGMGTIGPGVSLVGDSLGRDFSARDETGHGTHVAGVICAGGIGMERGVAGRAPVIPVRALAAAREGRDGPVFGVGGLTDIDAAIKVAVDMGARVLNMSFGTARDDLDPHAPDPHAEVLEYATAMGCIPVAAMGNSGDDTRYFPAALETCIAVGSVDGQDRPSEFSTRGAHVDLAAPGEAVVSAGLDGYRAADGTSHAAPFVAGATALLVARAARAGRDLSLHDVRQALRASARRDRPPDDRVGWGVLDIPAALAALDTPTPAF